MTSRPGTRGGYNPGRLHCSGLEQNSASRLLRQAGSRGRTISARHTIGYYPPSRRRVCYPVVPTCRAASVVRPFSKFTAHDQHEAPGYAPAIESADRMFNAPRPHPVGVNSRQRRGLRTSSSAGAVLGCGAPRIPEGIGHQFMRCEPRETVTACKRPPPSDNAFAGNGGVASERSDSNGSNVRISGCPGWGCRHVDKCRGSARPRQSIHEPRDHVADRLPRHITHRSASSICAVAVLSARTARSALTARPPPRSANEGIGEAVGTCSRIHGERPQ